VSIMDENLTPRSYWRQR